MGRRRYRHLIIGPERYRWWVSHQHVPDPEPGSVAGYSCREVLTFAREGSPGVIRVVFASGPDRVVGGGGWGAHEGGVSRIGGGYLNLHRPATVRAVIDEVLADGRPFAHDTHVDGWLFFEAALIRLPPERQEASHTSSG
ncbi:hypothetical protein [Streptomyces sp. NPDC091209]|uniref:hypothetical protein n=1 Tax=Streptomyces sp. NPDC091209 TaxID=3365974 RepID=UPI003830F852